MQWNDKAIVLSARKLGEHSGVIHVITPGRGLHAGVDRAAFTKRKRGIYQPGNVVAARWHARLSEHMGIIDCELVEPVAVYALNDRHKLAALASAAMMTEKTLPERDSHPEVFASIEIFVSTLKNGGDWLRAYVELEFTLLECAGFGLDLERCASTGQQEDLYYVSPRSGRSVSRIAGAPYHDRLFVLPEFLRVGTGTLMGHNRPPPEGEIRIARAQILDGVRLCGYFLEERVFAPRGLKMPAVRERFVKMLSTGDMTLGETA